MTTSVKALERAIDYLIEHRWVRIAWYFGLSVLTVLLVLISEAKAAHASYTGCIVQKETRLMTRPGGDVYEPRLNPLLVGHPVAIRDTYKDWIFVIHELEGQSEWGWLRKNEVSDCKVFDGTP